MYIAGIQHSVWCLCMCPAHTGLVEVSLPDSSDPLDTRHLEKMQKNVEKNENSI